MYNSQLTVFVCVADCGSFSKTAEKLFLSVAVMKQINSLEKHLNLKRKMYSKYHLLSPGTTKGGNIKSKKWRNEILHFLC